MRTDRHLIKADVCRRMGVDMWRLNQIIKSLGGFPSEIIRTDPVSYKEQRVYDRQEIEQWIEVWENSKYRKKEPGFDNRRAAAFICRPLLEARGIK